MKASPGDNVKVGDVIMILDTDKDSGQDTKTDESISNKTIDNNETKDEKLSEPQTDEHVDAVMGGSPSASSYSNENSDKSQKQEQKHSKDNKDKILALPKVRKKAEKIGVDLAKIDKEGRITEEDLEKASGKEVSADSKETETIKEESKESSEAVEHHSPSESINASPSVKRLARKKNVNLSKINGSGRGGEITREDIKKALKGQTDDNKEKKTQGSEIEDTKSEIHIEEEGLVEKVDMNGVRKATAKKMKKSKFTAPHVTHVEKADITDLVELRESVKGKVDAHLTYLPFIMKALIAGLKEHPDLNAELDEEHNQIIRKKFYDFNIAVDTDRGLLVPRIENVDSKNMVELAEAIGDKAEKAQNGDLSAKEMAPGTFSITNLGVIGGEEFTPIIYPPQTAILGIGKITETAEVIENEVVPRTTVRLCLSYDHRVVDGAEAAHFINKVIEDLENPRELILEL